MRCTLKEKSVEQALGSLDATPYSVADRLASLVHEAANKQSTHVKMLPCEITQSCIYHSSQLILMYFPDFARITRLVVTSHTVLRVTDNT